MKNSAKTIHLCKTQSLDEMLDTLIKIAKLHEDKDFSNEQGRDLVGTMVGIICRLHGLEKAISLTPHGVQKLADKFIDEKCREVFGEDYILAKQDFTRRQNERN